MPEHPNIKNLEDMFCKGDVPTIGWKGNNSTMIAILFLSWKKVIQNILFTTSSHTH